MELTILGNNSAKPIYGRYPTAQILKVYQDLFLIDCGEATQIQLQKYKIKSSKITRIFISHLHGDHYFGLIGLLSSMQLSSRTKELFLYGPPELIDIINLQFSVAHSPCTYTLHFIPILPEESKTLFETEQIKIECFPVQHRIATHGFRFIKKKGLRKINIIQCQNYEVPFQEFNNLKRGEDYISSQGKVIKNEILTEEGDAQKSYVYAADTRYFPELPTIIGPCDLLYNESTYLKDLEKLAFERYHCTAAQAAMIAKQANAKNLLLGHFSSRYKEVDVFLNEAKEIFPNTMLSEEGKSYNI